MYVQVGGEKAWEWLSTVVAIQGGKYLGELYIVASITQSFWNVASLSSQSANDRIWLVVTENEKQSQAIVEEVTEGRLICIKRLSSI